MVHAAFVRSTHAHARLVRIDLERARRAPSVAGVLTGDAVARLCKPYRGILRHYTGMKTGAMLPLAVERVRYVGEPIVAVAAESRAAADDAAALIEVEYQPLPAVLSPEAALAAGAPLIHPELGDNLLYETRLAVGDRSEEHTSELQSLRHLVCRLLLESSGDPCDLHSSPTRRSSDLDRRGGRREPGGGRRRGGADRGRVPAAARGALAGGGAGRRRAADPSRARRQPSLRDTPRRRRQIGRAHV